MDELTKKIDFKEVLETKIKKEFMNLIPVETLNEYINKVVTDFEKNELEPLIKSTLRKHAEESIKTMLQSNSYGMWNNEKNMYEMTPELEKIMINAAPKMFGEIMREIVRMTLSQMGNQTVY